MPYKEKTISKLYFTISELAADLKIATSQLRFYEQKGIIRSDKRLTSQRNERMYTAHNADCIRKVVTAAKSGYFTTKALKRIYDTGNIDEVIAAIDPSRGKIFHTNTHKS